MGLLFLPLDCHTFPALATAPARSYFARLTTYVTTMAAPWNGTRAKVQLRLAVERTRALQAKLEAVQKADRKALSGLVERGKVEAARVRTEALIQTDVHIELLELLELYTDTLIARFALLDHSLSSGVNASPSSLTSKATSTSDKGIPADTGPDPALSDALSVILYAAPQAELRELHQLREVLSSRLPRDWALAAIEGDPQIVPARVLTKVGFATRTPDPVLVDAYIAEICSVYQVPFTPTHLPPNPTPSPPLPQYESDVGAIDSTSDTKDPKDTNLTEGARGEAEQKSSDVAPAAAAKPATSTAAQPNQIPSSPPSKTKEEDALAALEARFASLKRR